MTTTSSDMDATGSALPEDVLTTVVDDQSIQQTLTSDFSTFMLTSGSLINLFGVLVNGVIMILLYKDKSLRKPYNALLGSMAVSDMFCCGVLNIVQVIAIYIETYPITWPRADLMCRLHSFLRLHLILVSILHVMSISMTRYLLVLHPQLSTRVINKRTITIILFVIHIMSCVIVITSSGLFRKITFIKTMGSCKAEESDIALIATVATTLSLSALVLLYSYMRIHRTVYLAKKKLETVIMERSRYRDSKRSLTNNSSHKYILQCMMIIFISLIVGFLPGLVVLTRIENGLDVPIHALPLTMLILFFSNAAHSLVYVVLDTNFKRSFKSFLNQSNTVTPSNNIQMIA